MLKISETFSNEVQGASCAHLRYANSALQHHVHLTAERTCTELWHVISLSITAGMVRRHIRALLTDPRSVKAEHAPGGDDFT